MLVKSEQQVSLFEEHFALMSDSEFNLLCDRCNKFHISAENVIEFPEAGMLSEIVKGART